MILGDTSSFTLAIGLIEAIGFCLIFLMMDRPRFSWKNTVAYYSVYLMAVAVISLLWVLDDSVSFGKYCIIIYAVQSYIFFVCMSSDTPLQVLYNCCLQISIMLVRICVGMWLAKMFFDSNPWVDICLRVTLIFVVALVYYKVYRKRFRELADNIRGPQPWKGIATVALMGDFIILYDATYPNLVIVRDNQGQFFFWVLCAILFATHIVMIYTLTLVYREMVDKELMRIIDLDNGRLQRQLEIMDSFVDEARRLRHDVRHQMLNIAEYAKQGQTDKLLDYLAEYETQQLEDMPERICENSTVNNILNAYRDKATGQGIACTFDVTVPKETAVKDKDYIAIFGNAMENAINGCLASGAHNPEIQVYIAMKNGRLAINISNTCAGDVNFEGGVPLRKTMERGIGVSSMLHSVESYGGMADFKAEDGKFLFRALIHAKNPK